MRNQHSAAEKIKEISGTNPLKCMKCGKCSATCPSFNEMDIKPHQFVSYVVNEDIEALVNSKSLCTLAYLLYLLNALTKSCCGSSGSRSCGISSAFR